MNVINAKLDIIFKRLFTSDKSVLTAFTEDLLDFPHGSIQKLEVLNPELLPETVDGKQGQLDIKKDPMSCMIFSFIISCALDMRQVRFTGLPGMRLTGNTKTR